MSSVNMQPNSRTEHSLQKRQMMILNTDPKSQMEFQKLPFQLNLTQNLTSFNPQILSTIDLRAASQEGNKKGPHTCNFEQKFIDALINYFLAKNLEEQGRFREKLRNSWVEGREIVEVIIKRAEREQKKKAVKKSYFFNKLIMKMESDIDERQGKMSKKQKKFIIFDRYLPDYKKDTKM